MPNPIQSFQLTMDNANSIFSIYDHLHKDLGDLIHLQDLLRYQLVMGISALDKLIHDLIRIGMVRAFVGDQDRTPKFRNETISFDVYDKIVNNNSVPAHVTFEQEIYRKLSYKSFQDHKKMMDGLSLIWSEQQKWSKICEHMNVTADLARIQLTLIVTRRNAIVHEADIDPVNGELNEISRMDNAVNLEFIGNLGRSIDHLISN